MAYQIVGNTTVEWDPPTPFIFTMHEASGPADDRREKAITIDFSGLRKGFEDDFLLHLKEILIHRRNKVMLSTINCDANNICSLFRKVLALKIFDRKISIIDESFLLALGTVKENLPVGCLRVLKTTFTANPYSQLFAPGLHDSDFPEMKDNKGAHGRQINRILAKALSRAACVRILSRCEQAYDTGEMDIGHFSFVNLAFAVFCRPESYRQIRLEDLKFDQKSNSFFIYIIPAKTGVHHPDKICYRINEHVGVLLQKQRQDVIERYGHLVGPDDIGRLALFPARKLRKGKSFWVSRNANQEFGRIEAGSGFDRAYSRAIKEALHDVRVSLRANVLRHTVGTQLALTGASAQTIQAVLKHSSGTVCRAYVDIAFEGLFNELSDAMQPAFNSHLPAFQRFRSKSDPVSIDKAIRSEDLDTGKIEVSGECGKQIQCEHAPIVCYGCWRFTPCWDADHSVNLNTVQLDLEDFKQRGKPFHHMIQKTQEAKYQIILVMNAADRYRQTMTSEAPR